MTKRQKRRPAAYRVLMEPRAHVQRRKLPGNVRQRLRQTIDALAKDPRPHNSRALDTSRLAGEVVVPEGVELRRIRLGRWRVVYAVDEVWQSVAVLTIRQRPPYDYEDLIELAVELE